MTEHELDRQLRAMQQAIVDPPLVQEEELPIVRSSRRGAIVVVLSMLFLGGFVAVLLLQQEETNVHQMVTTDSVVSTGKMNVLGVPLKESDTTSNDGGLENESKVDRGVWHRIRSIEIPSIPLRPTPGSAGTTGIELSQDELERMGIYFDSVTAVTSEFGGFTFDTSRSTFKDPVVGVMTAEHLVYLHPRGNEYVLGSRRIPFLRVDACRPAGYYAVLQSTSHDTIDKIAMIMGDGGMHNEYTKAGQLAAGALVTLFHSKMPIDELLNYTADAGRIKVPLKALLLPIRFQTPWVRMPELRNELVRMDVVYVFLASRECLMSLPEHIRSFIGSEYRITLDAIEDQLTQLELCERLEAPSAFGVCPTEEGSFSVLSVGPIPARDHIRLQLRCTTDATATIHLIDAQGQLAYEDRPVQLPRGVSEVSIPLSRLGLPRGAYTMIVTVGNESATRRILID
ncbi:MAG: T9SS type A sorting domain-containing protein [Bacteroidetes bacterium]|nr:T9SS type A sorting domain-containing protein [Bacteroidota bacterium]